MEHPVAILAGARTPFGRAGGALARLDATALARACAAAALDGVSIPIDAVIVTSTWHQHEAAAIAAGAAGEGTTLLAVLGGGASSGLQALQLGALAIARDGAGAVLVIGVDSATTAPHLLPGSTRGARLGHGKMNSQVSSADLQSDPGADLGSSAEVRQAAGGLVPVTPPSKRPLDPIERDDEPGGAPGDGAACVLLGRPAASAPGSIAAFAWAAAPGDVIAALAPAGSHPIVVAPSSAIPVPPAAIGLAAVLGALDVLREGGSHEINRSALALTAATGRGAHGIRLERTSH